MWLEVRNLGSYRRISDDQEYELDLRLRNVEAEITRIESGAGGESRADQALDCDCRLLGVLSRGNPHLRRSLSFASIFLKSTSPLAVPFHYSLREERHV